MHADPAQVTLREITARTVRSITRLTVSASQQRFVAPNAVSLAQALFEPTAWYRAVYFAEEPVGFVMLADESLLTPPPADPKISVWRFMVDARFQGRGIGKLALLRVIEHAQRNGRFEKLELSYVPAQGGPEHFYRALGFTDTGKTVGNEVVLAYPLGGNTAGGRGGGRSTGRS